MKKKKILVADDEPEIVDIVKRMLEDEYEVITAYDGDCLLYTSPSPRDRG